MFQKFLPLPPEIFQDQPYICLLRPKQKACCKAGKFIQEEQAGAKALAPRHYLPGFSGAARMVNN